jgi:DNA helicase-2/ATP-dependent DNA helicase PcrA
MPRPPAPYARRGTAFHAWLESRWGQQRLLDPDELPGAADEGAADDTEFTELRERFEASEWAAREPLDIEVPFETIIGDRLVRGRMDAVFRSRDGRYEVVDWKTGRPPSGDDARLASVQLAAYRLAWAELTGVPVEQVSPRQRHRPPGRPSGRRRPHRPSRSDPRDLTTVHGRCFRG